MTNSITVRPSPRQRIVPSLLVVFGICNIVGGGALYQFEQREFEQRASRARDADAALAEFNRSMAEKFAVEGIAIVNKASNPPTELKPTDFSLAWFVAGCGAVCISFGLILSARNQRRLKGSIGESAPETE